MNVEEAAQRAYEISSRRVFRLEPGRQPKRAREASGPPSQHRGVTWNDLPDFLKETWREVARAVLG